VAAQLLISLLYGVGAARRYRRDDSLGFTPVMGLLLLAVWVAVAAVQMLYRGEFLVRGFGRLGGSWSAEFIVSLPCCVLLGILPVASATRMAVIPPRDRPSGLTRPWQAVVLSFAIVMALTVAAPAKPNRANLAATAAIVAAVLVSARYVLEIAYRLKWWPRRTMFLWLLLTWCVPFLLELLRQSLLEDDPLNPRGPPMSILGLSSPIGALVKLWGPERQDVTAGVMIQGGVALAMVAGVYAVLRPAARRRGQPVAITWPRGT
jgi:hypothetical protein